MYTFSGQLVEDDETAAPETGKKDLETTSSETLRRSLPFQRRVLEGREIPELLSGEPIYGGGLNETPREVR